MEDLIYPYWYDTPVDASLSEALVKHIEAKRLSNVIVSQSSRATALAQSPIKLLDCERLGSDKFVSQHTWQAFMQVVRKHFPHLPFYLDPCDALSTAMILEQRGHKKKSITFRQAVGCSIRGFVQFTTNPMTLETVALLKAELPVDLRHIDVAFDLEVTFRVCTDSESLLSAICAAVVELRAQDGSLIDVGRLDRCETVGRTVLLKTMLLKNGLPLVAMPFSSLKVSLATSVAEQDECVPHSMTVRAEWSSAYLSRAQRQELAQSSIVLECPPLSSGQPNALLVSCGTGIAIHLTDETELPISSFLCARQLLDHTEGRTIDGKSLPHAFSCPDCRHSAQSRLETLMQKEIELTPEELAIILGDPGSL